MAQPLGGALGFLQQRRAGDELTKTQCQQGLVGALLVEDPAQEGRARFWCAVSP
jgi:hypothetical protein